MLADKKTTKKFVIFPEEGNSVLQYEPPTFRERTRLWWEEFSKIEGRLREIMDQDAPQEEWTEATKSLEPILKFTSIETYLSGERYHLIFELLWEVDAYLYIYMKNHMPSSLKKHWDVHIGTLPSAIENMDNWYDKEDFGNINYDNVDIWLQENEQSGNLKTFELYAYSPELSKLAIENKSAASWRMHRLINKIIGQLTSLNHLEYEIIHEPIKDDEPIKLSQLKEALEMEGIYVPIDLKAYLEEPAYTYSIYDDPEASEKLKIQGWDDVIFHVRTASAMTPELEYYTGNGATDMLEENGVVLGYFVYPLEWLEGVTGYEVENFQRALELALMEEDGIDQGILVGCKVGENYGYTDFIGCDSERFFERASKFFKKEGLSWAAGGIYGNEKVWMLKGKKEDITRPKCEEIDQILTGCDYIPYNPQNPDAFFQQLNKWDQEGENVKCIQALNTIPQEWNDFEVVYAKAVALTDYAIMGNKGKNVNATTSIKCLLRARHLLETVREEGMDTAKWHRYLGYIYEYIPYETLRGLEHSDIAVSLPDGNPKDQNIYNECYWDQMRYLKRLKEQSDKVFLNLGENGSDDLNIYGEVLLLQGQLDKEGFYSAMKEDWGIDVKASLLELEELSPENSIAFKTQENNVSLELINLPSPAINQDMDDELAPEDMKTLQQVKENLAKSKAFIKVKITGSGQPLVKKARILTQVLASYCKNQDVLAAGFNHYFILPEVYRKRAEVMKEGALPISNWISVKYYLNDGGTTYACSCGMNAFEKYDVETASKDATKEEMEAFIKEISEAYLEGKIPTENLDNDGDDEAIAFECSDGHCHKIHLIGSSLGVPYIPNLKVSFAPDNTDGNRTVGENCLFYTSEENKAVTNHIEKHLAPIDSVLYSEDSDGLHVELCVVPASRKHNHRSMTIVTRGMGAYKMRTNEGLIDEELQRAELAISLPYTWEIDEEALGEPRWNWPCQLLEWLAKLPIRNEKPLGFAHTVNLNNYVSDNALFTAVILVGIQECDEEGQVCVLPDGQPVNFYQVIPIYKEELDYCLECGIDAFFEKLAVTGYEVNIHRPPVVETKVN